MRWTSRSAKHRRWRRWFAWRPVTVDHRVVWLEWIERKKITTGPGTTADWVYRLPNEEDDE